jgi:hypothetical protein
MDSWAEVEMWGAALPHGRYRYNLAMLTHSLVAKQGLSFSAAAGHGGRQFATRLFSNSKTTVEGLLRGHFDQTCKRCAKEKIILVPQDSSSLNYSSHTATTGLGPLNDSVSGRGLHAHSALSMTTSGLPLGVLYLEIWARKIEERGTAQSRKSKPIEEKESFKWIKCVHAVTESLSNYLTDGGKVVVIGDREADIFDLFAEPRARGMELLVRANHPRLVELAGEPGQFNVFDAISSTSEIGSFEITVPAKGNVRERKATLELRLQAVEMLAPKGGVHDQGVDRQPVWVVQAREDLSKRPPGLETLDPISWTLLTTMPVRDAVEARQIVDYYTKRWNIEVLHHVLKSGLAIERLQFDDSESLKHALAVCWVAAWRMFYLTIAARKEPTIPASEVLEPDELAVLEKAEGKPVTTVEDAVQAIAKLGGYYPSKKRPPGVKSLWLGQRALAAMVVGWRLATLSP